jgi:hypothetical protein
LTVGDEKIQPCDDDLRAYVTLAFSNCFSDIRVEFHKYEAPEKINGSKNEMIFTPDVTARSDYLNIFEIETAASLDGFFKRVKESWSKCDLLSGGQ